MRLHALFMLCGTSLALAGAAAAEPAAPPPNVAAGLPPGQIMAIVRATGFDPIGRPVRNGNVYALQALDPYDVEYRIVVDARTGRTVSVREIARPGPYEAAPRFGRVIGGPPEGPALRPPHDVPHDMPHGSPAVPRGAPSPSQRSAATTTPLPAQKPAEAALPLPRPRPYVMEATSSTPVDPPAASARAAEAQPTVSPNPAAPEATAEPQPAADPPTGSVAK